VAVAGDRDGDVDAGADGGPDESRDTLRPVCQDLHCQGNRVDVGAVIRNDTQGQYYYCEFTEGPGVVDQYRSEKSSSSGRSIPILVSIVSVVQSGGRHDRHTEHLCEQERDDKTEPRPKEHLPPRLSARLINGIISSIARPSSGKSVDHRAVRQDRSQFRGAGAPIDSHKVAAVSKDSEKDEEDDCCRDPGPELVGVHDFVAESRDSESQDGDYNNADRALDVAVDCLDELGPDDRVNGRPTDTG
jgi:hypothetical protein